MPRRRVLMIGLDGFDISLAERFMEEGSLPNIASLGARSARFDLDHGVDKDSGLAWEHVSTGQSPSDGGRWSAVTFDPATYGIHQDPTSSRPFLADLSARTVVFDVPYCDLSRAPNVRGLTHWGGHDPGVEMPVSRPKGLHAELWRNFGPYPAPEWLYGFCWPSAEKARNAGVGLTRSVDVRNDAARWLLSERLPDWDFAMVVVSEAHSAIEALWHGVDSSHPLHTLESGGAAAKALRDVYNAIDRLIGDLQAEFPDATLVVFAMHGMGPNDADVPTMVLLPELLYRATFGTPYMNRIPCPDASPDGVPLLAKNDVWTDVMLRAVPQPPLSIRWPRRVLGWILGDKRSRSNIDWMPAARYKEFWPRMTAFAMPAYLNGRIRINLQGREGSGVVPVDKYDGTCGEMVNLLRDCHNLLTGDNAVEDIRRPKKEPMAIGPTEADLYVVWKSNLLGLSTTGLGDIGPVPYLRTGGHTGPRGFFYLAGDDIAATGKNLASSFDVVPTILDLLGEARPPKLSGRSLAEAFSA